MADSALKYSDGIKGTNRIGFKLVGTEKPATNSKNGNDFRLHVQPSQTYIDFQRGDVK